MTVCIQTLGKVLTLTLQRPEKKNALSSQMYQQLTEALQFAQENPDIHVVIIQGQDNCFTAGNDLADFVAAGALDAEHPTVMFLHALATFPKPLIAVVAGPAIGIGTTALLHCDLVYAADNSRFQMPFTALGLCPEAAASLLLPKLMGQQKAAQYLLLGEAFSAAEAQAMGLVNAVLSPEELFDFAKDKAQQLAVLPLAAVMQSKRLLRQPTAQLIQQVIHQELAIFEQLLQSEECQQRLQKFLNRG